VFFMETSISLLERLAAAPSDDDWRRLHHLFQSLLGAWLRTTRVPVAFFGRQPWGRLMGEAEAEAKEAELIAKPPGPTWKPTGRT
jgi:hypothetical protein